MFHVARIRFRRWTISPGVCAVRAVMPMAREPPRRAVPGSPMRSQIVFLFARSGAGVILTSPTGPFWWGEVRIVEACQRSDRVSGGGRGRDEESGCTAPARAPARRLRKATAWPGRSCYRANAGPPRSSQSLYGDHLHVACTGVPLGCLLSCPPRSLRWRCSARWASAHAAGAVSRSECPDLTAADMDQDADRCLARHDDPPPQRVRPAAQSDQDFLRQVSGLVSRSLRRSDGGNRLPPSPCLALLRRHNVARSRFRYANGCGVRPGVHHGMISISDAALVTCDVRTWQGISDVSRDASAGKLNEPLHGADLQNSLSSSGSTVNGNPPGA
jgi:hypothetical protein